MFNYKNLIHHLRKFEECLDDNHELYLRIAHFHENKSLRLAYVIHIKNDDLVSFELFDEQGKDFVIIQHYSQINFEMIAFPKSAPDKPAKRIGFKTDIA